MPVLASEESYGCRLMHLGMLAIGNVLFCRPDTGTCRQALMHRQVASARITEVKREGRSEPKVHRLPHTKYNPSFDCEGRSKDKYSRHRPVRSTPTLVSQYTARSITPVDYSPPFEQRKKSELNTQ